MTDIFLGIIQGITEFLPMVLITFEVPGFPLPEDDMSNFLYFATIYAKFSEPIR